MRCRARRQTESSLLLHYSPSCDLIGRLECAFFDDLILNCLLFGAFLMVYRDAEYTVAQDVGRDTWEMDGQSKWTHRRGRSAQLAQGGLDCRRNDGWSLDDAKSDAGNGSRPSNWAILRLVELGLKAKKWSVGDLLFQPF